MAAPFDASLFLWAKPVSMPSAFLRFAVSAFQWLAPFDVVYKFMMVGELKQHSNNVKQP
ncbi:MAG: hypothetical protein J6W06_09680 [Bacteroidales bacterium]|nr:hypothetical protein [Bacteroidales bacterium]